jgi:two-component system LytT family response regulator
MKIKALIVDDEHSGRVSLKILLNKEFHFLFDTILTVSTLEEAIEKAANDSFHICFLDIELGNKSGFDLLPHFSNQTKVVFVTAYSEYSIQALREKAFDYLLKPINPAELKACIRRYEKEMHITDSTQYLCIKEKGFTIPIHKDEILFMEANGAYSKIHLVNGKEYTTAKTLKNLTEIVGEDFIRIHKSYTVSKLGIKSFKKDAVHTITNICLPVSRVGAKSLSAHY